MPAPPSTNGLALFTASRKMETINSASIGKAKNPICSIKELFVFKASHKNAAQ